MKLLLPNRRGRVMSTQRFWSTGPGQTSPRSLVLLHPNLSQIRNNPHAT